MGERPKRLILWTGVHLPVIGCAVLAGLVARPARAQTPDGRALYKDYCLTCHGADGKPAEFARRAFARIPDLSDSTLMAGRSQDSIVAVLVNGAGEGTAMTSFKNRLTRDQMVAVARFVLTLSTGSRTP